MDLGFQRFLTGERMLFWCATGRVTNLRCFPALTRGEAVNIHIKGHLASYFSVSLIYFSLDPTVDEEEEAKKTFSRFVRLEHHLQTSCDC